MPQKGIFVPMVALTAAEPLGMWVTGGPERPLGPLSPPPLVMIRIKDKICRRNDGGADCEPGCAR